MIDIFVCAIALPYMRSLVKSPFRCNLLKQLLRLRPWRTGSFSHSPTYPKNPNIAQKPNTTPFLIMILIYNPHTGVVSFNINFPKKSWLFHRRMPAECTSSRALVGWAVLATANITEFGSWTTNQCHLRRNLFGGAIFFQNKRKASERA